MPAKAHALTRSGQAGGDEALTVLCSRISCAPASPWWDLTPESWTGGDNPIPKISSWIFRFPFVTYLLLQVFVWSQIHWCTSLAKTLISVSTQITSLYFLELFSPYPLSISHSLISVLIYPCKYF